MISEIPEGVADYVADDDARPRNGFQNHWLLLVDYCWGDSDRAPFDLVTSSRSMKPSPFRS
jgi:hypothetical protein